MHIAIKAALTASLTIGALSGASAQSLNPSLDPNDGDTRIVAAITVPLGQSRDRARTAPRVELIARSRAPNAILPVVARDEERRWNERRIGFTLDGSEQLMINGRPMMMEQDGDGISTLGAIGIGVGVLLAATIITLADGVDAIEDLGDPD